MSPPRARTARASREAMSAAPDRDRLLELSAALRDVPVAVVGDLVLDRYWFGRSSRISREAPVLILDFEEERGVPGGAANAAMNARSLGGRPRLVGRVGRDEAGRDLARSLRAEGLDPRWLLRDNGAGTIVKTRILAGSSHTSRQQIVRLDRGHGALMPRSGERSLERALARAMKGSSAALLSDYGYGVLAPPLRRAAIAAARRAGLPVVVDSRYALRSYRGVTLLTPNEHEIRDAFHLPSLDTGALRRAGEDLRERTAARGVWITRGSDGMMLLERGRKALRIPIVGSSDVADVTGAGDAVSAAATLALGAGASLVEAALLATYAASVVVMKRGTATVSRAELDAAIRAHPVPRPEPA
ncbi:MAG TPA: PfkB family carbohydrate kinase [Candidatus Eisenbacteria bacterium]|nr:PfkB family carbohydrate kinase [Candidatus Eisenbacteria bacterium]